MARRNDMDICHDILKVAQGGVRKTRIVYQANLNFKIVRKYLTRLLAKGLIEYDEESKLFFTTDQGSWFIVQYSDLVAPLKDTPELPQMS